MPHQRECIVMNTECKTTLVADEPGLGKTGVYYLHIGIV